MELSNEIRRFANEIENKPTRITLEEIIDKLRDFENLAEEIEQKNFDLEEENEELKDKLVELDF